MIRDSLQDDLFAVISNDAIHAATRRASKRPLNNRNIKLVRCFKGGYNAQQETPIMIALEEFTTKGLITVETLHCERVKKDQMTEKQVDAQHQNVVTDLHVAVSYQCVAPSQIVDPHHGDAAPKELDVGAGTHYTVDLLHYQIIMNLLLNSTYVQPT
jgi:hypothetical protein